MKIYRGAKQGLNKMIGGSFYTEDYSIAESYANLEEDGVVYEFNTSLKLFNADNFLCASDIDEGIEIVIEELEDFDSIFESFDGLYTQDGIQIILFGTIENNNFTKQSFKDLMTDVNAETRRYDR